MEAKLYYTPPSIEIFEEVKEKAISIWNQYDNTHGYVDEKVNAIKDIENVKDNLMFMVAMFDFHNQRKLSSVLSDKSKKAIADRMLSGGNHPEFIPFL